MKNILAASPGVLFVDSNYEDDLADAEPLRHSDLGSGSDTLSKAVSGNIPDIHDDAEMLCAKMQ